MHFNFIRNFRRLAAVLILLFFSGNLSFANNDVCSVGTGIPPFLSAGINPNLLLVFDNSGSMLETAYIDVVPTDPDSEAANDGACVDNDYDTTQNYAGLFDSKKWYRWVEGVPQWQSGATYAVGNYVYTEGVFYKATEVKSAPVAAFDILSDTSVIWERVHEIPSWASGEVYPAGSFVQFKSQLYYTASGGTASGTNIDADTIAWIAKESTWLVARSYVAGDVVSDQGMLYRAASDGISAGTGVADDTGVNWISLGEGHFEEVAYSTSADAASAFAGAAGTAYQQADLFIKITSITINGTSTPVGVSSFVASGNLLNWASASKLDIQKEILTGGKFHPQEELLVSEGRGCSSRGFVKEVPVQSSAGARVLTFSIRGADKENWIDTTDFTTRISILGVSTEGFIGNLQQKACQEAINLVAEGADAQQGQLSKNINECLSYEGNDPVLAASNAAYNHSIHTCWTITKQEYTNPSQLGNVNEIENACEKIYDAGVLPSTIEPWDSGYMCYGVYNDTLFHADREGYVGRCWEPGSVPAGCVTVSCGAPYGVGDPRCYSDNLLYKCSGNYNSNHDTCNKPWELLLVQDPTVGSLTCDSSAANVIPAQWTDDLPEDPKPCIQQGMWDYCGSLKIPEVIDPTDQLFNTNETWGMVGAMIDSGVVAMFGTNRPLIVMKGYIKPPVDDNNEVKLQGKVQEFADNLRMGVMAFNNNGSFTECKVENTSLTIERYCPQSNLDGAEVLAPIKDSNATTNGQPHLEYLVQAINDIRATSWTPLAEAMYNALGYYGQNVNYWIQENPLFPDTDPVQVWCQANNILFITDGGSSADVNVEVAKRVTEVALTLNESTGYSFDPNQEGECTVDGIVPFGQVATNRYLYGSTYFDDLTYFGQNVMEAEVYATPQMLSEDGVLEDKQNIRTYVIQTGNAEGSGIDNDCNPKVLMEKAAKSGGTNLLLGQNPDQLNESLLSALRDILARASAGSAASVVSSARSGAGAIYQAVFWPELETSKDGVKHKVEWVGDVRSLFVDENGFMYEDTNQNRKLDVDSDGETDVVVGDRDKRVWIYYDTDESMSKACYEPPTIQDDGEERCNDSTELENVRFLWSANDWLADLCTSDEFPEFCKTNLQQNRPLVEGRFDFSEPGNEQRFIFTWVDLNSDGIVNYSPGFDGHEIIALESKPEDPGGWGSLTENFMVKDGEALNELIVWLRGEDQPTNETLRTRQSVRNGNQFTWRLGDVIHSTPTAVTAPGERYWSSYNDITYLGFAQKYRNRRHVVYFGSNSGMLHAVNAGFYSEAENKFCLTPLIDNTCEAENANHALALGAELWAYVPYNLLPHLKCLMKPGYTHKYFVDLTPQVFDVQIFNPDIDHPSGWGTILVGGMRFGGAPVAVPFKIENEGTEYEFNKPFVSSYFILDITNPEKPPVLLAELTQEYSNPSEPKEGYIWANLGYTTAAPTRVFAKRNPENGAHLEWYLVFGSGPTGKDGLKGVSDQQAKISVFPLHNLVDKADNKPIKAMRFPREAPTAQIPGTFYLPGRAGEGSGEEAPNGFVSDLLSVDFDTEIRPAGQYFTDAVYFGTVEGNFAIDNESDLPYWQGGSRLNRLVMNKNGHLVGGLPEVFSPGDWGIKPLIDLGIDTGQVITAAPRVSTDGYHYWVYFGTGRFFDADDKTDSQQQSYYGIKEPVDDIDGKLTWGEVGKEGDTTALAGEKGLLKVDPIFVPESGSGADARLACRDATGAPDVNDFSCLPPGINSADTAFFNNLETYIAGSGSCSVTIFNNCVDGWYKDFYPPANRERNLSHAVVTGGMVNFTTYQPYSDVCKAEGEAYLYSVYYRTGTAWFKNIFGTYGIEYDSYVRNKLVLGRGLATSPSIFSGSGVDGAIAFLQTSTAEISETQLDIVVPKSGPVSWREFQP